MRRETPVARIRLVLSPEVAIGPGKVNLLEGIRETGSISAAGRRMGMSYKRAWMLVDTMNGDFSKPLVKAIKGGKAGGGAALTALGKDVLERYRRIEQATAQAAAGDLAALNRSRRKPSKT